MERFKVGRTFVSLRIAVEGFQSVELVIARQRVHQRKFLLQFTDLTFVDHHKLVRCVQEVLEHKLCIHGQGRLKDREIVFAYRKFNSF